MTKDAIAFLPYWRIADTKYTHFDRLSEIIYFSLTVDGDGSFVTVTDNETDPGWRWWQSSSIKDLIAKTQISGGKFSLTVGASRNKKIVQFLSSSSAQNMLIANLKQEVISRNLDGINLDFEYDGIPDATLSAAFTAFAKNLSTSLRAEKPLITLSLDVLPSGGRKPGLLEFAKIQPFFDRFILMTYDYYGANSEVAGPVAPMQGFKQKKFLLDVSTTVVDYKKLLPKNKLLLGIPYYGWDWPVEKGATFMSPTLDQTDANGYSAVISYGRMRTDRDLVSSQCFFDDLAQAPWCWYTDRDTKKDHQVWFENDRSIQKKFDFVEKNNLGGIAIWTLGYDKQYENLWNLLSSSFSKK